MIRKLVKRATSLLSLNVLPILLGILFFSLGLDLHATNPWPTSSYSYRQYGTSTNFINARVFVPLSYDANTTDKHPVVVFCHGDGEKQTGATFGQPTVANSNQMSDNGQYAFVTTTSQAQLPCFFILIQRVGPSDLTQAIKNMVDTLSTEFHSTGGQSKIDLDRVIITGLSGGGGVTMSYMCSYSSALAAAVVLSPATPPGYSADQVGMLPVWFFHADNDGVEQPPNSISAVNDLRRLGAHPIFTYYDTGGHSSTTWTAAYNTPALMPWLAAQRRGQPSTNDPAVVTITSPSTSLSYSAPSTTVTVSGTCTQSSTNSPSISLMQYSRGDFGDAKISDYPNAQTASGTIASWNFVDSNPVNQWNPNPFLFCAVAVGTSWSTGNGGHTYYGSDIFVTKPDGSDTISPLITISSPTTASTYSTSSTIVSLGGTASDNVGVTSVTWTNSTGGSGTASGTTTWAVSNISLASGANVLTVTAHDAAGHATNATITVTSSVPPTNQPPVVNAGVDQSITLPAVATLAGTVTDDGVSPGNPTPTATWTKVSGTGTVTFGNANSASTTASFSVAGTYVLRLTGSDGVLTTSDDATITASNAATGGGASILFDFGASTATTSGNWNNVTDYLTGVKISNAIDSTGASTGIALNITAQFSSPNSNGTTSSGALYPVTAAQDSFYTSGAQVAKVKLQGLSTSATYSLKFYASRLTGGADRVSAYTVGTTSVTMDATDNVTNSVTIDNIVPASDGTIEVQIKSNSGSGYGYLGVMEVISHHEMLFDFGASTATTSGNWNNVTDYVTGVKITNAVDNGGSSTGVGLNITAQFSSPNSNGTTSSGALYPVTAAQDSFYTSGSQVAKVKLTGLNTSTAYSLTFFASRLTAGDRVTAYTVGTSTVTMDATDNVTNTVTLSNITPASDGTIEVQIKSNSGSGYGYLGVLDVKW